MVVEQPSLQKQIDKARADIRTDAYALSLGEWMSIYERKEMDIHPEFQRFFRWSLGQKSRLIESVLLGIPIPPIFVAQQPSGIWDVVDGVQRLSTVFEFAGILRDDSDKLLQPLALAKTQYLPSLQGKRWEDDAHPDQSLTQAQRLLIKRSKIDVSIILAESAATAKYELFQRLNTGGSQLADQEVRNSIVVMLNKERYRWLKELSEDANFRECVALSERAADEQYNMELVLRFVVFRTIAEKHLSGLGDIGDFLTEQASALANDKSFDASGEAAAFRATFQLLKEQLGDEAFRKYDATRARAVGGFSVSAFEAIALGVGYNYKLLDGADATVVRDKARGLWKDPEFYNNSGSGINASRRVSKIVPYGRKLFAP
ncbi:MAG: DUF262 domain-containing protein [Gemmatimonadales bacterium]